MKIPKGKPVGSVYWSVDFGLYSVSFKRKRDAETFKRLLLLSVEEYPSDIVRREITDEGFHLH